MKHSKSPLPILGIRLLCLAMLGELAVGAMSINGPLSQKAYAATGWQKLSQSELTVIWWQWTYSVPASQNPALDDTGANAYNGQPYSDLLFLTGTLSSTEVSGDVLGHATRSINVKQGTALFFPIINDEFDNVCNRPRLDCDPTVKPHPTNLGVPQLQAMAAEPIDSANGLFAMLTPTDQNFNQAGAPIEVPFNRLPSPHPFPYKLPPTDNLYQAEGIDIKGTVAPAVGDGYYSLIPLGTLQQGYYKLKFGGRIPITGGNFILDITYDITVTS